MLERVKPRDLQGSAAFENKLLAFSPSAVDTSHLTWVPSRVGISSSITSHNLGMTALGYYRSWRWRDFANDFSWTSCIKQRSPLVSFCHGSKYQQQFVTRTRLSRNLAECLNAPVIVCTGLNTRT
jgi:hypothetical protein